MSKQESLSKKIQRVFKSKAFLIVLTIFIFGFALRLYQLDLKYPFGYDQVVSAWAAKDVIINHQFPLVGMVAKGNSGIYVGPLYFYFVVLFYYLFNLNPVAFQLIAVVSAALSFFIVFYVTRKLFNTKVAIIALIINTFNFNGIVFDTIQWPVQLMPAVSLVIFYLLYQILKGDVKKLIYLAMMIGIAFNLHFTAIFFPIIVLFCLPLFPRTKKTLKYFLISLPLFLIWLVPNFVYYLTTKYASSGAAGYFTTYYHGFHLRRMMQLLGDAVIQFDPYLLIDKIKPLKYILFPLFFIIYLFRSFSTERKKFAYLVFLWFFIPLLIFTTYKGEISDYYFCLSRFVVLFILAYLIYLVWNLKPIIFKIAVSLLLLIYAHFGITNYLAYEDIGLAKRILPAKQAVLKGEKMQFLFGAPESYIYYYLMKEKGIDVY